ncbi:hypothetical protein DFJ58DRAFT_799300 [Suillus subalutaceus]|uniref:uncharacterized protein n=1 Tax=Suillus subalutaceus TaxID=48586 RepID=UPI001B87450E|nr:uncharacterized protein DFJ58DRAFT_799300 [Suillus subalutaceus]KAG1846180.1 hypothetical protein DFJ58DRAFT_799300 [Suillus subalutaceus]
MLRNDESRTCCVDRKASDLYSVPSPRCLLHVLLVVVFYSCRLAFPSGRAFPSHQHIFLRQAPKGGGRRALTYHGVSYAVSFTHYTITGSVFLRHTT